MACRNSNCHLPFASHNSYVFTLEASNLNLHTERRKRLHNDISRLSLSCALGDFIRISYPILFDGVQPTTRDATSTATTTSWASTSSSFLALKTTQARKVLPLRPKRFCIMFPSFKGPHARKPPPRDDSCHYGKGHAPLKLSN